MVSLIAIPCAWQHHLHLFQCYSIQYNESTNQQRLLICKFWAFLIGNFITGGVHPHWSLQMWSKKRFGKSWSSRYFVYPQRQRQCSRKNWSILSTKTKTKDKYNVLGKAEAWNTLSSIKIATSNIQQKQNICLILAKQKISTRQMKYNQILWIFNKWWNLFLTKCVPAYLQVNSPARAALPIRLGEFIFFCHFFWEIINWPFSWSFFDN